jgi:hypothetical protein
MRLVQPHVPGTVMCGDHLVIKPTGYIMRGFGLETTSLRDHVKLWRVVMPLHRPFRSVALNYSDVIAGDQGGRVYIDRAAYQQSAADVLEKILPHVEPLRRIRQPQDFLQYISWMARNDMLGVRTDFGLTHYLLGNTQQALDIFRQLDIDLGAYQQVVQEACKPLFRQVLNLLENDPPALRAVIESWRDQNIEKLGLSASVAIPALRLV